MNPTPKLRALVKTFGALLPPARRAALLRARAADARQQTLLSERDEEAALLTYAVACEEEAAWVEREAERSAT